MLSNTGYKNLLNSLQEENNSMLLELDTNLRGVSGLVDRIQIENQYRNGMESHLETIQYELWNACYCSGRKEENDCFP